MKDYLSGVEGLLVGVSGITCRGGGGGGGLSDYLSGGGGGGGEGLLVEVEGLLVGVSGITCRGGGGRGAERLLVWGVKDYLSRLRDYLLRSQGLLVR